MSLITLLLSTFTPIKVIQHTPTQNGKTGWKTLWGRETDEDGFRLALGLCPANSIQQIAIKRDHYFDSKFNITSRDFYTQMFINDAVSSNFHKVLIDNPRDIKKDDFQNPLVNIHVV